ncbi:hypothetical protein J6590_068361 [Homalodisca vitripennis]|nr:hypothetical protein J6590_068361 [Homalodisca vitripennis]
MSGSDEGTSQNDNGPANINSSRPRTSKRVVAKSWNNSDEDMTNSDSDGDYHPSRAVSASAVNGYTRKRKPLSRPTRNMKINNKQENGNDELSSEKSKPKISNSVYVKLYNNINVNEPSTSKAAGISLPVRRAKMIHVEEKSESSEEEDEVKLSSHKKINNTINGKISKSESEESSEDTKSEILENGVNNGEDDGEEEKGEDEDNEDDREEDENSEENSESESSDNDSDEEFKPATSQKPVRKTVKCIYPKRRIAKETDSDNVKENCLNIGQKNKKVAVQVKVNQRTRREVQTRVSQGKYPLRQTTKKNLVEESSDESKEEGGHYYKTRKSNQRPINGTSLYVENSNESENSSNLEDQDEDVGDSVEDDDSDAYTPSTNITRRGQKRRRSSDSTGGWSSGRGIYQRLRNTGCSKKTANGSDNSAKGRNCRTRSRKRKNSDSDVTLESNNSDSDNKPAAISVSSRGRVRKLTPRARAFLRD